MFPSAVELVERLRKERFPDGRTTVAEVEAIQARDEVQLRGAVLDRPTAEAFVGALRRSAPGINWRDELTTLVAGPDYGWAIVPTALAHVRQEPGHRGELISQAIFGETVEILRTSGAWAFVRLPDGYLGWIGCKPLYHCSAEVANSWREQATHLVIHPTLPCYAAATGKPEQQVSMLPFGAVLHVEDERGPFARVRFPNHVVRWVPVVGLLSLKYRPLPTRAGLATVVGWMQAMIGVPYLWGGRTPFGYDCSGLVQIMYGILGIHLKRDADQQATQGIGVPLDAIEYGDLLFFDTAVGDAELQTTVERRITHVGMALTGGDFLHASSAGGGLCYGSFNEQSPAFLPTYRERLLGARRFI